EPRIEKARKAAALVLVDEHRTARCAAAARLADLLREPRDGVIPRDRLPRAILLHQRRPETIRIVQSLERRLSAGAQRAAIQRMVRIALELDRAAVARFGDDAAGSRTLAARRGVVRGDAGNRLVGRHQIWNELAGLFLARRDGQGGARGAKDLQEFAALDAGGARRRGILAHVSSGSSRNRTAPSSVRPWPRWPAPSPMRASWSPFAASRSRSPRGLPWGCSR